MVILKPAHVIRFAIEEFTDPVVASAQRRFGWNRFDLIARIEFVRTPIDFVLVTLFIDKISGADWHGSPMPLWASAFLMSANVIWTAWRLRAGWEMRQVGMGRDDEVGRASELVAMARRLSVRHWYWTLVAIAGVPCILFLSLALLIDGFFLASAQEFGVSAWIALMLLSHALWNRPDVAAILPALSTDD